MGRLSKKKILDTGQLKYKIRKNKKLGTKKV
jgi:hypothetical protein